MLRVGVIGAGAMGKNHIRIYSEMPGVELAGISDIDKDLVESLAQQYNTKAFTDYKEMLASGVDAVSIVVPTKMHRQVAIDAIEAGAHVLVEKPIADSVENADAIIEAAEKKGLLVMVGHIERFNPAVIKLKEIIDSGLLGKIVSISTTRVGPYNPRIRDVGVILDIGVHDIDVISYLYGTNVNQVYAVAGADIHSFEDHATIHMRLDHEFSGLVEVNWLTPHKVRKLTAVGVGGVAYLDYMDQTVELHDSGWIRKAKIEQKEPLRNELEYFIDCINTGKQPNPSGTDGKHALKVSLAAISSYKEAKMIDIKE
ncbi:MAG: UDP-N-acetylglucosamine 3-dehydrogenase [Methanolobus sp.]|jgi:UDP-N-acetylglucosamine 3-dehydrogenase|uniref:UDP-N-acetylglucosamine 3-dehydrogenase n=1 Tax=Methanolobus sp. TaxID=1874737 RepID=UPI0024AB6A4A|nr:UDP-N-acetylglucosamine 3-dehydrogenase [Methanolobus sp.]MDI3486644.1 UDP-N-acetylglucosamine 3-dehydrogenase [Methanolobus sp.]MDK2830956.1 UDP-N-acetylglucosamine 3-dehydrogenase [Methanolobus sp.]MDK2940034.1 UDP-N-acetylglucosamine 3-dehydrogenase [Methanolobus sp.]MDK2948205.1 UDP-N-acetylglucosamine 3-dehydrogenase [Methanolobus sp.]